MEIKQIIIILILIMTKVQSIQLAKSYISSWKQIRFRGDYIEEEVMCLFEVYDYIFGSIIFDLNKFIEENLVEFTIATDIGSEKIQFTLEEYLNSDLFRN